MEHGSRACKGKRMGVGCVRFGVLGSENYATCNRKCLSVSGENRKK